MDLHKAGVHVSTHAIGDRAIDWTKFSSSIARHFNGPVVLAEDTMFVKIG